MKMKLLPDREHRSKTHEKKRRRENKMSEYGHDMDSKLSASIKGGFRGFVKPKLKKVKKSKKDKMRERKKILDKINTAIQSRCPWGEALVSGRSNSHWMKKKMERIENLVNLEHKIREDKLVQLKERSFVKRFVEAKIDPK